MLNEVTSSLKAKSSKGKAVVDGESKRNSFLLKCTYCVYLFNCNAILINYFDFNISDTLVQYF